MPCKLFAKEAVVETLNGTWPGSSQTMELAACGPGATSDLEREEHMVMLPCAR